MDHLGRAPFHDTHHDTRDSSSSPSRDVLPHTPHHSRPILPLPDLRFESSYLRSVRAYVHINSVQESRPGEKGKGVARPADTENESRREVVRVQLGKILWITVRDQVISPLLQGALWGVASHFLIPMRSILASSVQSWWGSSPYHPNVEGGGITRLRSWVGGLYSGTVRTSLSR